MIEMREAKNRLISYKSILWFLHISITALAVIDRFTTNAWPRQMFSIGAGSAGSDRITGFKPGPWSVVHMMSLLEFRDVSRSAHLTSCSSLGFRYWSSGLLHLGLRKMLSIAATLLRQISDRINGMVLHSVL